MSTMMQMLVMNQPPGRFGLGRQKNAKPHLSASSECWQTKWCKCRPETLLIRTNEFLHNSEPILGNRLFEMIRNVGLHFEFFASSFTLRPRHSFISFRNETTLASLLATAMTWCLVSCRTKTRSLLYIAMGSTEICIQDSAIPFERAVRRRACTAGPYASIASARVLRLCPG